MEVARPKQSCAGAPSGGHEAALQATIGFQVRPSINHHGPQSRLPTNAMGAKFLTSNYFLPQTFLISIPHLSHSPGHPSQSPGGLDPTQVLWPPFFTSLCLAPGLAHGSLEVFSGENPTPEGRSTPAYRVSSTGQVGLSENRKQAGDDDVPRAAGAGWPIFTRSLGSGLLHEVHHVLKVGSNVYTTQTKKMHWRSGSGPGPKVESSAEALQLTEPSGR